MDLFNPFMDRECGEHEVLVYRKDYGACRVDINDIEIITSSHPEFNKAISEVDIL
jgi:hypothetical protein